MEPRDQRHRYRACLRECWIEGRADRNMVDGMEPEAALEDAVAAWYAIPWPVRRAMMLQSEPGTVCGSGWIKTR